MLTTKRKPATVGEVSRRGVHAAHGLTQAALAEAMGVQRKHVNESRNDCRNVTAPIADPARVFGNSADFWLNVQRRSDLWEAMNSPRERERINAHGRSVPRRDRCHTAGERSPSVAIGRSARVNPAAGNSRRLPFSRASPNSPWPAKPWPP